MLANRIYRGGVELSFRMGSTLPNFSKGIQHFILVYHGVTPDGSTRFNARHEPVSCFEKHIRFLRNHFHIIQLADFFQQKFRSGKINVAITFDDGYRNNFLYAKPILEKYSAPATIFITGMNEIGAKMLWADFLNITSYYYQESVTISDEVFIKKGLQYVSALTGRSLYHVIKNERTDYQYKEAVYTAFSASKKIFDDTSLSDYWQLMSDDEIRQCSRSAYIEIGSHGYYHNNLGVIAKRDAEEELIKSKHYLEKLVQQPIVSIAYPDSSYNRDVVALAGKVGFHYQLSADGFSYEEDRNDDLIRDRIGVYNCGRCGNQLLIPVKNYFRTWKST